MDSFVEQLVVKKKSAGQIVAVAVISVIAVLLIAFSLLMIRVLGPITAILITAVFYGAWYLLTAQNIEYEYCITNNIIDIDCIVAQRRRKRIVSVKGNKIEAAGKYVPEQWAHRAIDRTVIAAPSKNDENLYYFTYHSKKSGHTLVVFQPDDRVKESFYQGLPRLIQLDWEKE
ncbi:MAG: hypothetical protein J6Q42_06050 [Clostridia bacterium]|jgi:hypothetical protein|nr:hypothetical protein [Clostridia bacterium]